MALTQTTPLSKTLNHPQPIAQLKGTDAKALAEFNKDVARHHHETQIMIERLWNDLYRNIAGFNLVGLDADLPAAGQPGRTFTATDTGKFYKDVGSGWISTTLV